MKIRNLKLILIFIVVVLCCGVSTRTVKADVCCSHYKSKSHYLYGNNISHRNRKLLYNGRRARRHINRYSYRRYYNKGYLRGRADYQRECDRRQRYYRRYFPRRCR